MVGLVEYVVVSTTRERVMVQGTVWMGMKTGSLPVEQRRVLAGEAVERLKSYHDGEMYGCHRCYRDGPYYQGPPCPERALVVEYERLAATEDKS
jgi:hypothetical protein